MSELSDRIEELVTNRSLSYQEFADRVNAVEIDGAAKLTKSFVADIINGDRQPKSKTIVRIARAFDISADYLLGITDIPATINDDGRGISIDWSRVRVKEYRKGQINILKIIEANIYDEIKRIREELKGLEEIGMEEQSGEKSVQNDVR